MSVTVYPVAVSSEDTIRLMQASLYSVETDQAFTGSVLVFVET